MSTDLIESLIILVLLIVGWIVILTAYYTLKKNQGFRKKYYMSRNFLLGLMAGITVFGIVVIIEFLI